MNRLDEYKAILRDQFAMHSLQGILANEACMREVLDLDDRPQKVALAVVTRAYVYADECMKNTNQNFDG